MAQDYVVLNETDEMGVVAMNKAVFKSIAEISINDIENAVFQALKKELSLLGSLYGDIKKEEQSLKEASRKASRRKTLMEQELKNQK